MKVNDQAKVAIPTLIWPGLRKNITSSTHNSYTSPYDIIFPQVVWTTSTQLGIGYARSTDRKKVYVVARYSPPGNYIGQYATNVPLANYLLETFQNNCNGNSLYLCNTCSISYYNNNLL